MRAQSGEPRSRRERPAKPALTRAGIVAVAVEIMRAEGLPKVTVRRLAQDLDTGPASLYVYFRNTAELHAAILDELLGTIAPPPASGDWRDRRRQCDARLTVHLSEGRLRCHHCGFDTVLPLRCPQCGFTLKPVGQGTERIEEALMSLFPGVTLARLDRDVVRRRGEMEEVMRRVSSGEARILVGTQMVTKGHDFPNLTLVVVLNADQGLFSIDFRGPERLAQTIVQVAGRAGRGAKPGEVLIQTEFPGHPLLISLLSEGYEGFARAALAERQQTSWPPFSRLAAVRDSAKTAESALDFLTEARNLVTALPRGLRLLGPVPAAMSKRAGRYHAQLLVEGADRSSLHHFLDSWLPRMEQLPSARRVRWDLDVDPIDMF